MARPIRAVWAALAALFLAAPTVWAAPYAVQPEDVLTISVLGHADLTRDVVVLQDGQFTFPLVGRVDAAGRTTDAVAETIARGLVREVADPQVTVSVKQPAMRRVYVSGQIAKAGSYDLKPGWRVSHLLAESGGLSGKPEMSRAAIVRGEETIPVDLVAVAEARDRAADPILQAGDLLQVQPDTNLIHIVGEVKNPGDYQLKDNLGVLEAVAMAGGAAPNAALTRAQILRAGRIVKVDLHALLVEGKAEGNMPLAAGDTLVIPANEARIAVLGAVGQPGYYDLPDGKPITVADALGFAKGPHKNARIGEVALVRSVDGSQVVSRLNVGEFLKKGDLSQNPYVHSGDVVYVAEGKEPLTTANVLSVVTSVMNPVIYSILRR